VGKQNVKLLCFLRSMVCHFENFCIRFDSYLPSFWSSHTY